MASSSSAANIWVLLGLGLAGIFLMTRRLKKTIREDFGAFVQRLQLLPPPQPAPPKAPHPLTSFSFAVSDIFDIDGYVTGFGNPDWATTHEAASWTSSAVSTIVEGGATCIGKTVIDEMAYSINGENKHYGTPTNPEAHARIPGGCSSGSAVAVAAELVDFSLGVDSVGGVRVPGAFCGILGFRPSHGAVSNIGVIPVSPSLDTVGVVFLGFSFIVAGCNITCPVQCWCPLISWQHHLWSSFESSREFLTCCSSSPCIGFRMIFFLLCIKANMLVKLLFYTL